MKYIKEFIEDYPKGYTEEEIISGIIHSLRLVSHNSKRINSIKLTIDYESNDLTLTLNNVNELIKILMLNDNKSGSDNLIQSETIIRSAYVILTEYYHSKGWMSEETFEEFATKFTRIYEFETGKKLDRILEYDQIGNYFTINKLGYNTIGGYSIRKLHGSSSIPYIIDKHL